MLALALLAVAAAPPDRAPHRFGTGAWAIGYAAGVERACPNWRRVPSATLAERGLLDPATRFTGWGYDSPLHRSFWSGMTAARHDHASRPGFCRHPARFHQEAPIADAIEPAGAK